MTTMNISLPDELKTFVERQVARGGFSSASEYLRTLIRDAQRQEADRKLESLLLEGLESGQATRLTPDDWQAIRHEALQRLKDHSAK